MRQAMIKLMERIDVPNNLIRCLMPQPLQG